MARITVRIPDELKERMDDLDQINWSAVVRKCLETRVEEMEKVVMSGGHPPEVKQTKRR